MPTLELDKKEFLAALGKQVDDATLRKSISLMGIEVDDITASEIHVEVFPQRPDLLSLQGIVRNLKRYLGLGKKKSYVVKSSSYKVLVDKSVNKVRPYTACAVVTGIHFSDQLIKDVIQIQEKLHVTFCRNRKKAAIGVYPLEDITFPIYYKAAKPKEISFIPLEADREMNGLEILQKHPTGREYAHLLEGKDLFPYFIDAKNNILSMPPIINSEMTGRITEKTKDVFIEASGFDFETVHAIVKMIVAALIDMGGVAHEISVSYPDGVKKTPSVKEEVMKLHVEKANAWTGLDLSVKEMKSALAKMDYEVSGEGKILSVTIPFYRTDILHEVDLWEDVAIGFGYDKITPELPNITTVGKVSNEDAFAEAVSEVLVGAGLTEVKLYGLMNKELASTTTNQDTKKLVTLLNPSSSEYNVLRKDLLSGMLGLLGANKHNEYPQDIFEVGRVFSKDAKEESGVKETDHIAVLVAREDADFTKAKQVLDCIAKNLGFSISITEKEDALFVPGRSGTIMLGSKQLGRIGEIHPEVLARLGVEMPTAGFEIAIKDLFSHLF
ncbi:MAG: phenylalanine--tRNA ligase subunit beta [Candidatus Woesearchaeota archaeon]|nr:MAG: phenylalanine--tRNA ligase subunit beta [Candidatus Woesearchaeota archaeon]